MQDPDPIDAAISRLWERRTFPLADRKLVVACLIRAQDRRPLKAPWWTKKKPPSSVPTSTEIFSFDIVTEAFGTGITRRGLTPRSHEAFENS
jgi:hypothetical protein